MHALNPHHPNPEMLDDFMSTCSLTTIGLQAFSFLFSATAKTILAKKSKSSLTPVNDAATLIQ
jgi:hypothetical protein